MGASGTAVAAHPAQVVRVRPAPALDPPVDDRRQPPASSCPGQLALAPRRLAAGPPRRPTGPVPVAPSPGARPPAEAHLAVRRFVHACVEVLNGFRPVNHLRELTGPVHYASVADQLTRRCVRLRMAPPTAPVVGRPRAERVALVRVRVCEVREGVAEAVAVLSHRDRSWAVALRVERGQHRWVCTVLQVV
jgi:uncharacterized protein DUF6459